jgi:hypothetical protein
MSCQAPLTVAEKSSFGDWLTAKFFSSLWLNKKVVLAKSPTLDTFPVAAIVSTIEISK